MEQQDNGTTTSSEFKRTVLVDVKTSMVTRASTVRASKTAPEQQVEWTYDFGGVSEEQLLELASRTVHILRQGQFRNAEVAEQRKMVADRNAIDVAAMLAAERAGFKPTAKSLAKAAGKLSPEEKAALLKLLNEE